LGCTGQQAKCGRGLEYIKLGEVKLHIFLNMFVINYPRKHTTYRVKSVPVHALKAYEGVGFSSTHSKPQH
jgi:hypothetical protein